MDIRTWLRDASPTLIMLLSGIVFFTIVVVFVRHFMPKDDPLFQLLASMLTGFGGGFFTYLTKFYGGSAAPPPIPPVVKP
jgi:uncharacterized membrane-anchored protein